MRKFFKISAFILLSGIIIFFLISVYFSVRFVSPNRVNIGSAPIVDNVTFENVTFRTNDNLNIRGWYSKPDTGNKVIILLHGYKANRLENFGKALMLKKYGYGVLTYYARACGESDGEHISLGYYETKDLFAAIEFVKSKGSKEIGLIGFSQGGATIVQSSEFLPEEVKFVILESVFPDLRSAVNTRFVKYFGIPGVLGSLFMVPVSEFILKLDVDDVSPYNNIRKLHVPVLIMVGENDTSLPLKEAFLLSEVSNEPTEWHVIKNAIHKDLFETNSVEYEQNVVEFLNHFFK